MNFDEVTSLGGLELRAALADKRVSSVEVVEALLGRIQAIDAPDTAIALRSVLALSADALEQAKSADATPSSGPLHGLPIMIKDNIEAVGLPGTAGSMALAGRTVARDAELVARLRSAGAIVVGSTNLSEWANIRSSRSTSGWSAVGGLCRNPWALDRSAGGSSSGSGAAVAARLTPWAIGTETDGSITCPASLNGVVGIKPTVGTVSTVGVIPLSSSQDAPGPLARSVRDAATLLEVLSGQPGFVDACSRESSEIRVGLVPEWFTRHAPTNDLVSGVFDQVNVTKKSEYQFPPVPDEIHHDELTVLLAELHDELGDFLASRPGLRVTSLHDVVTFNRENSNVELRYFDQDLFEQSLEIGGKNEKYLGARRRCVEWSQREFGKAFAQFDVLMAPAYAPAWKNDFLLGHAGAVGGKVTTPAALLGLPILTLPAGLSGGMPVGLALVGKAGSEATLVALAAQIEQLVGFDQVPTFVAPQAG